MKISKEKINRIAQELDSGMTVYINSATLEIKAVLACDDMDYAEFWDDEIKKIEKEWDDYVILEKMDSHTAFSVMENPKGSIKCNFNPVATHVLTIFPVFCGISGSTSTISSGIFTFPRILLLFSYINTYFSFPYNPEQFSQFSLVCGSFPTYPEAGT